MNLRTHYQDEVAPTLMKEFGLTNLMAVPKVHRVVVNIGLKEAVSDKGILEKTSGWLGTITGQKPKITRAKLSIAAFKVRAGDAVGLAVTLRGQRMYDFLNKLFNIVLPRVRDFQGVSTTAFDKKGNYTLGLTEQIVFSEIEYSQIDKVRGLEITLVTNAGDVKISRRLLELLGMPFKKD
ncbi:MAG: 50S ribosomal protein L5 [bacterium]|nr:50S ribosomal protein L5 [bacterium]